tara:strand:- start:540 stop:959 length:420 start_codon:yes stop_codon:yes gene_type:complete
MEENNKQILTKEGLNDLSKILNLKYASYIKDRTFSISCYAEDKAINVQILLKNSDKSFFYPVECRLKIQDQKQSVNDLALLLLDYMDVYFDEFFKENENAFIPIDWTEHNFEGVFFQMRGQIINLYQELKADKILTPSK